MVSELGSDSPRGASPTQSSSTTVTSPLFTPTQNLAGIKLDETNFLIWKQQVLCAVKGHRLNKLLEDSKTLQENPELEQQDYLLSSWLLSSISSTLLPHFVGYDTASSLWQALTNFFSGKSKARILQLKNYLQTSKKGNQFMQDYLLKIKALCDNLALCGKAVPDDDHILYIIAGLGHEYEPVISTLLAKDDQDIETVRAILLTAENRVSHQLQPGGSNTMVAHLVSNMNPTNTTMRGGRNSGGRYRGRGRGGRYQPQQTYPVPQNLPQQNYQFPYTAQTSTWQQIALPDLWKDKSCS